MFASSASAPRHQAGAYRQMHLSTGVEECARLLAPVRSAWAGIADRAND